MRFPVRRVTLCLLTATLAGCGGGSSGPAADNGATRPATPARPAAVAGLPTAPLGAFDAVRLYQSMGLLADGPPLPVELRRAGEVLAHAEGVEQVRVVAFKETARTDESVLFQQVISVPPGTGDLVVTVRDETTGKASTSSRSLVVPRLGPRTLSSPVPFYEVTLRQAVESLPRILVSPRSTIVFGRDSVAPLYVEAYGDAERVPVRVDALGEGDAKLWSDTATLVRHGRLVSGVVRVPATMLGIGVSRVAVRRLDSNDSTSTPVFISFGEELPVATYEQMVSYLRYFASPGRLARLRDASPESRAAEWAAFVRESGVGAGPTDVLRNYFARIELANARFRDEGVPGWLTDRGMVYVTLGEPDRMQEPTPMDMTNRGRVLVWEYLGRRLTLVFVDQSGSGRWRLTPSSATDFSQVARVIQEQGGRR
ncbi:MAG: GWxTD domain-containing protein [Gemmatimonadetes bacterium]|nr:GWxTD domain-containing protein [Gemmatimonadota bacterium]